MRYAPIEEAIEATARGEMVLVVDDEDRENEGDLIVAAEKVTPEHIAFMVRYTSGLICLPMTGERLDELGLPLMVMENTDSHKTAFTVSIDFAHDTTTGISAADRAATIRAAVDRSYHAADFHRPGHVFPLRYQPGGVLVRPGHTEAASAVEFIATASTTGGEVIDLIDFLLQCRLEHLVDVLEGVEGHRLADRVRQVVEVDEREISPGMSVSDPPVIV